MQLNYMLVCVPHLATFPSERQIEVYTSPNQYLSEMLLDLQAFKTTPTTSNQNVNPLYMNNDVYQCLPYANINIRMDTTCIQYAIFVNMSGLNSSSVYIISVLVLPRLLLAGYCWGVELPQSSVVMYHNTNQ